MKKKLVSAVIAASMVAGLLAGCGSTGADTAAPAAGDAGATKESAAASGDAAAASGDFQLDNVNIIVDGTLTATVDSGQAEFVQQWEAAVSEKLGHPITLNITQLDHSDYSGTVSRTLTTGAPGEEGYPDALIMSATMLRQYQTTGLLWNLSDAYDNAEFQSRIIYPEVNQNLKTADGAQYGFSPTYGNGCVTYLKQSWLDKEGKTVDDIKTFNDYYELLKKYSDGKTYGVIAAGYGKLDEAPFINYMPEWWQGAYPSFYEKDGTWVDGFTEQATIDALARLHQGYVDGIIDPDTEEAGTKQAREKFFSNDQSTSEFAFTYWAGQWLRNLTDNMSKNEVDDDLGDKRLVQLPPVQEIKDTWGGYLNREAPVWVITDDGDGDNTREQAIFDALFDTMLDGDKVQTLWTYGAEDVHWSVKAETFTTNADDPDKKKDYEYADGEFHLKQSPNDPDTIWKKNHLDPVLVIAPLTNGYTDNDPLVQEGNKFFLANCVDAPAAASSETLTANNEDLTTEKTTLMNKAVVGEITPEEAVQTYIDDFGDISATIIEELNAQSAAQ
ncbi:MAG: hypothetical protein K6E33_09375 [Lachnospiraceae bacterium]|nr:hypothetical protein [Lachnospiraceae bacterium]